MINAIKKSLKKQASSTQKTIDNDNSVTPMMQQYIDIKKKHKNYLLFYRMGDFYELFLEDATVAAKELDIVLTKRGKNEGEDIPMCGVPHHSYENYLNRLIKKGYKVAICEQVETPEEAKKQRGYKAVVKREVTRIVTQGTLTDEKMLDKENTNNLVSIHQNTENGFAIAWCDISTGELLVNEVNADSLSSEIERINPAEIIICDELLGDRSLKTFIDSYRNILTSQSNNFFSNKRAKDKILNYFNIKNLQAISNISSPEISALGALIEYIQITQLNNKPNLSLPKTARESEFVEIDSSTFRNLEIFRDFNGKKEYSLFGILNKTNTASGARLLQSYLARPLKNITKINERYDGIDFLTNSANLHSQLEDTLSKFPDIERISSRVHSGRGTPRDLALLRDGLFAALKISELFTFSANTNEDSLPKIFKEATKNLNNLEHIYHKIVERIIEFPPINLNEGGFIKSGFNSKLDDYRNTKNKSEDAKLKLLEKYKSKSGIANLKIKENNVIGMFFETSPNNIDKIPTNFTHKQTLASCVRYTNDELREVENKIINADSYAISIEIDIFNELRAEVISTIEELRSLSKSIATIDIISCFSKISKERNYCRPEINNSELLNIKAGRHPVVEASLAGQNKSDNIDYTPNDLTLNKNSLWLLTGPNMSGKSTFLRQNALICIMAQIGCYIPASSGFIGLVDKVFSRVGASDNLSKGQSTFMVEMLEAAFILNNATKKSFVIFDEIGRGTSTFDGLSIAWATLEFLDNNIKCRGLFATHYHELTTLANNSKTIENYTLETTEWNDEIIFKHNVIEGVAGQSYGVHVAKLAGMPSLVTDRASKILKTLQDKNKGNSTEILSETLPLFKAKVAEPTEKTGQEQLDKNLRNFIKDIDLNNLTPIQALNLIQKIKNKL